MSDNLIKGKILAVGILLSVVFCVSYAFASETNGTIDGTYKYAWGENIGWINFGCDNCKVKVTDDGLSGDAWSSQFGWINLNPTTSGVRNTGEGVLSGFAWSPNLGWIDFGEVSIDSSGNFSGFATLKSDGSKINFNCAGTINSCDTANFKVKTDWRPASARHHGGGGGGGGICISPQILINNVCINPTPPPIIINPIVGVINNIGGAINSASDFFLNFFSALSIGSFSFIGTIIIVEFSI